ncbi:hypothetical protein Droror1_Dr00000820 [Drosera rotundifolia]
MSIAGDKRLEEYSYIGDKGEIGFLDFEEDKSICSYHPSEEGPSIISVPFPFVDGKPQSVFVNEIASDSITIRNTTEEPLELWKVSIYASNPENSFLLSIMKPPSGRSDLESRDDYVGDFSLEDRILQPFQTLTVWLSCKPEEIGLRTCIVHFDVGSERIERVVFLLVEDRISQALSSSKPYCRDRKNNHFDVNSYVPGVRPAKPKNRSFKSKLPLYEIPKEIREVVESKQIPDAVNEGLSRTNYVSYFKTLLVMEELQLEEDIKSYDMENVRMKRKGRFFLTLEVPGLAEKRPSLVHGDSIYAGLAPGDSNDSVRCYEGCIHRVEADEVYLKFDGEFHIRHSDSNLYNVRFSYNRVNMRRLYQAVEAADELGNDILFPSSTRKRRIILKSMVPITGNLNQKQINAVEMILGCEGGSPFLIHGPPGTGKTLTLVETILQLYTSRKETRILICASSNYAADHILGRLLNEKQVQMKESDIFRLNASSRSYAEVKPEYLRFCFYEEDHIFLTPPLKALLRYRIVITTYMSASLIYAEGVKRGHFSHIILDEAGQASEPETMVPISNLYHKKTVIVLAGDPLQLGPIIFSKVAESHGLAKSYLERLYECDFYLKEDESYVTVLVNNYRCHPAILSLPSRLFYEARLFACQEVDTSSKAWEDLLPNKEFPVLFFGIQGCDEREGNNPSWFNRIEASKVVEMVKKLTARNISETDIGIITPYRQQVLKIRKALESLDMTEIKIGSVEQFQGQEKQVIIISTVRSTIKHNKFDRTFCLGFLSNPRRFNVAITRAKSLLIIIANPHIICKDRNWEKLLWYCADNSSYQGCALPEKQPHYEEDFRQEERRYYGKQEILEWSKGNADQGVHPQGEEPLKEDNEWSDGWKDYSNGHAVEEKQPDDGNQESLTLYNGEAQHDEDEWSDGWKDYCPVTNTEENPPHDRVQEDPKEHELYNKEQGGLKWSEDFAEPYQKEEPILYENEWSDGWQEYCPLNKVEEKWI